MVSQHDLIQDYQHVAQELDKQPTLDEYNEHGEHSSYSVYNEFESFEELKEQAGFETGEYKHTRKELLTDLRRVAQKIERPPPLLLYEEHGEYNPKTLKRRFGSWADVLEAAGLEDTGHAKHWKGNEPEQFGKEYGGVFVECAHCGDPKSVKPSRLEYKERFFCNMDCKGKFMSGQTGEESRAWKERVDIECETCGETRSVWPSEADGARFCSQPCMLEWRSEYLSGENNPRYKDSPKYRYYGPNWQEQAAKARDRDNHECQFCPRDRQDSLDKWGEILTVHHIKRFYDFASYDVANELPNLITTCKECHTSLEMGTLDIPEGIKEKQSEWLATVPDGLLE